MAVNVLIALLVSLVFIVGVLVGVYSMCFAYSRAEAHAQRKERRDVAQRRTIERQRENSANWWKYHSGSADHRTWGEWKMDSRDFPS